MPTVRQNREFLMLSSELDKSKHRIGGMYASEKLDGMRAIWIPITRGRAVDTIPFANIEKDKKVPFATGLFSRYGKVIYAPTSFLDTLPRDRCLDGELWLGRQSFEETMSIVKQHVPNETDWKRITFQIFDSPTYSALFKDGRINGTNFKKNIKFADCVNILGIRDAGNPLGFEFTNRLLERECIKSGDKLLFQACSNLVLHKQELLPFGTENANIRLEELLSEITDEGGEGLMLRHPSWEWEPYRSTWLFKYKPNKDAEGKIIGYIAGKGKHEGRLGSLRLQYEDKIFDLGGFTDIERILTDSDWANKNPGEFTEERLSLQFPIGAFVTFKYRELTENGIPKEARYFRRKHSE